MIKKALIFNAIKGTIAIAFSNFIGYLLYFFILRGANEDDPDSASVRTVIFSLIIFAFSVFSLIKATKAEIKGESEWLTFKKEFRESNYSLDYKEYFMYALKTRLWGYYIGPLLFQIPIITNIVIVSHLPVDVTIYEYPISLYKWCTSSLFAYELLGEIWVIGFLLYMFFVSSLFAVIMYYSYKSIFVKPSYM